MKRINSKLIAHVYVYGEILKNNGYSIIVNSKKVFEWIHRIVRIPRREKKIFLREMQMMGLIKRINRDNFELLPMKRKVYDALGRPLIP